VDAWLLVPVALLAALTAALTAAAVAGSGRHWLLDLPGQHRSHAQPTPRGGGLGIALVLAALGLGIAIGALDGTATRLGIALLLAFAVVGAIGLWDDLRALPRWPRLLAHLGAAALVAWVAHQDGRASSLAAGGAGAALVVVALAWSINLHNFMDGIDGLLAAQCAFVLGASVLLMAPSPSLAQLLGVAGAAAALGFLPFNFPRARVFLGDVGSGPLGLLVGTVAVLAVGSARLPLAASLVLSSAFVLDATLTLASRIVRGRRWYTRHREHLYQWLARSGRSHARVVAVYALWNLLVALPVAASIARVPARLGWTLAAAVYAAGSVAWVLGRRRVLRHPRRNPR
jgi:UDP-N-acetylmuramyl pentapeptide phosphotransferase/UDP-N-acetylglucosamine-1-phosphate transferase